MMRNLAQATVNDTTDPLEPLLLSLPPDGTVKTVYIKVVKDTAVFSLLPDGPFTFGGITWQLDPEYGLFINFVFSPGDEQILDLTYKTPLFWLSEVSNNTPPNLKMQSCCVPSIAGTYKFFVNTASGRHDPKIVVTPL